MPPFVNQLENDFLMPEEAIHLGWNALRGLILRVIILIFTYLPQGPDSYIDLI